MSNAVKTKFAGMLRGLLRRFDDEAVAPSAPRAATAGSTPPAKEISPAPAPVPSSMAAVPPTAGRSADEISLSLQNIISALPMELRAKVMSVNTAGMMVSLPVARALDQLGTGSVKISFGELRRLAPGVFANSGGEHDAKPVVLPLGQILAQINPALLARRPAQKQVELGEDLSSPFDGRGEGLKISTETMRAPKPASAPVPLPRSTPPLSEREMPVQAPVTAPSPSFVPRWSPPAVGNNQPIHAPNLPTPASLASAPVVQSAPAAPVPATVAPSPSTSSGTLLAPLDALAEAWPEALRMEIMQTGLGSSQVALPMNLVEPALKRGRVIFSWRYLRGWIQPVPPAVSVHDGVELELPLKVLTPLFFARQKSAPAAQKKVSVAAEIPNLFFGFPQPASAPEVSAPVAFSPSATPASPTPAAAAPSDTNFFTPPNQPQTSDTEFKRKGGTDFLTRVASPSQIVFKAMELPGVAGAFIALPDGLKVASQIPSDLNADTLAAFVPQIFARVNQCSRELRMGDLNNLSFTVGNVPWRIFRVNAVYFAAFGRAGEQLPAAPLSALAAELDRRKI